MEHLATALLSCTVVSIPHKTIGTHSKPDHLIIIIVTLRQRAALQSSRSSIIVYYAEQEALLGVPLQFKSTCYGKYFYDRDHLVKV